MAKRKQSQGSVTQRPTAAQNVERAVRDAWADLKKTKDGGTLDVDTALIHPHWRRLFVYYCVRHGAWRSDTLDNWEYNHFRVLKELNDKKLL